MAELHPNHQRISEKKSKQSSNGNTNEFDQFQIKVVETALDLFAEKGYEATSVDDIADAAGVSRRTFFRQFHSKEDVIFADHEQLIEQVKKFLTAYEEDPYQAICRSSRIVFESFQERIEFSQLRYQVIRSSPVLRDREKVMVFRYERLYYEHLKSKLPPSEIFMAVTFSAAATSLHNYILRQMIRDGGKTTIVDLDLAMNRLVESFNRVSPNSKMSDELLKSNDQKVLIAVFDKNLPTEELNRKIILALGNN